MTIDVSLEIIVVIGFFHTHVSRRPSPFPCVSRSVAYLYTMEGVIFRTAGVFLVVRSLASPFY
jgi:hypothetical protein